MDPQERAEAVLEIADRKLRRGEISRRDFMKLTAAFGLVVAAPGALAGSAGAAAAKDETLRFLVGESFWANWNPYGHTAQIGFKIQRNLFDRLVEVQPDMSLKPGLATSWRKIDARTWEFKLRGGLAFHNGQKLTAADVKASIELASGRNPAGKKLAMASMWGIPHRGIVVDATTIRLRGDKPLGPLFNTLAITDILSAADVKQGVKHLEKAPNGTGAFKLSADSPTKKTLERFDQHYRGPAHVKTVVWEFIQDSQTRLNALLAGQADVIDRVEPDQVPLIKRRKNVRALSTTSVEIQSLWFRQDKAPFAENPALRRAVAWSIDRDAVASLVGGKTRVADSHLAAGLQFHEPQKPKYTYDPERAKAELKRSGATTPVSFELGASTGFYPKSKEVCELCVQDLQKAGFNVKLTLLELAAWIDMLFGKDKPGELFHGGWGNLTRDPDFAVATLFHSPGAWTGAHDKKTDALIDAGKTTSAVGARGRIYRQLQARLWNEAVTVPLLYSEISNGVSAKVSGLQLYPTFAHDFWPVRVKS